MQTRKLNRVETHIIKNNKILKDLCYKSKNLYNSSLYLFRQELINNNKWLSSKEIYNLIKHQDVYRDLPAQVSQQTLRLLDKNIKSYIKSIKDYSKNKSKYKGKPNLPKYLDKEGQFVFINPGQSTYLKNNKITLLRKVFSFNTKVNTKIREVRIVPKNHYHKIEVVYEKEIQNLDLDNNKYLSIDLGINNLMSITTLDNNKTVPSSTEDFEDCKSSEFSILVKGRQVKSINQYYNKRKSKIQSELKLKNNKLWSKKLSNLTLKRNQKIEDYFHKSTKKIVELCIENKIKNVIIGNNKDWKQNINLGKRNNQNFVQIPFERIIQMLQYKSEEFGIEVKIVEESYTSKIDHLSNEEMKKQENYLGKRIERGLFQSSTNKLINSDINGCIGILRKVVGDDYNNNLFNRGDVFSPIKLQVI